MTYLLLLVGLAAILLLLCLTALATFCIAEARRSSWKAGYTAGREAAWTAHDIAQWVLGDPPTREL